MYQIGKAIVAKLALTAALILYILPLYTALTNAFKDYESIVKAPLSLADPPDPREFCPGLSRSRHIHSLQKQPRDHKYIAGSNLSRSFFDGLCIC